MSPFSIRQPDKESMFFMPQSFNNELLNIACMFEELPLEVRDEFIMPLVKEFGWPFKSIQDNLYGSEWFRILQPLTLENFAQLRWYRRQFIFDKTLLHSKSQDDIDLVILNQTEDVWSVFGRNFESCRQSTAWHKARLFSNADFCAPVTLALTTDGLIVLDGNHRIAALIDSGLASTILLDAWIGITKSA